MAAKGVLSLDVSMQPGDGMLADHGVEMSRIHLGEVGLEASTWPSVWCSGTGWNRGCVVVHS